LDETYFYLFSEINPDVEAQEQDGKYEYDSSGNIHIDDSLNIVDDERPSVSEVWVMFCPQPNFKVGEGTEPVE
jgi:hypothetical protein